jgi:hypothetical protein
MNKDTFGLKGRVNIKLLDIDGKVKLEREFDNLITDAGRAFVASRLNTTTTVMTHLGIGTGTTAPLVTDTTLEAQLGSRGTTTRTAVTVNVTNDTLQHVATFPVGSNTGLITEAGLFNSSSTGTMLSRVVFAAVNKLETDAMVVTWRITAV